MQVEIPGAPAVRTLFQDEGATPASLRETKVGEMVSLAALGGGRGMEDLAVVEGEDGGPPPLDAVSFLLSLFVFLLFPFLFPPCFSTFVLCFFLSFLSLFLLPLAAR